MIAQISGSRLRTHATQGTGRAKSQQEISAFYSLIVSARRLRLASRESEEATRRVVHTHTTHSTFTFHIALDGSVTFNLQLQTPAAGHRDCALLDVC